MAHHQPLKIGLALGIALAISGASLAGSAFASAQILQTPLAGKAIPKFVDQVPIFGPGGASRVAGTNLTVSMEEFQQKILPASIYSALPAPFSAGTYVWGYKLTDNGTNAVSGPNYPAFTIEAQKNTPTTIKFVNNLVSPVLQQYLTVDQTLHWADPLNLMCSTLVYDCTPVPGTTPHECCLPFAGPVPTVVHLHGGEVPSAFDGGPDAWFTPNKAYVGTGFVTDTYTYPNQQEATTLFYHDHALGATRLNLYAGMVGFYLLRDAAVEPTNLPSGPYEIEMAIQDKAFDTNGQLLFPDGFPAGLNGPPPNPAIHPFWNPEFFGDVMLVNGKSWPYLNVEPRRYRLRLVNGSNARFLTLSLQTMKGNGSPSMFQIGTDGGYLNAPVKINQLTIAPGERADLIVDFTGIKLGVQVLMKNSAKAPFPAGAAPDPQTTGQVMLFNVVTLTAGDTSCNPALVPPTVGACTLRTPMVDLKPTVVAGTTPIRRLTLNEVMGMGGPVEVLLNNSKWDGTRSPNAGGITEIPRVGATEVWEIINTTADAHPIHIHLVQFQIINRQPYQTTKYMKAYNAAFGSALSAPLPTGCLAGQFCGGYGPPLPYGTNCDQAGAICGGNPDVTPFLVDGPKPPDVNELGWKDTFRMNPGEVTRVVVRWAQQDRAAGSVAPGTNTYPFDPTAAMGTTDTFGFPGGPGYVWHCHIVDHEDNEMMRPYILAN